MVDTPRLSIFLRQNLASLEALVIETLKQIINIDLLIIPNKQQVPNTTTPCTFAKLLYHPKQIQFCVNATFATTTLHLTLKRSPIRMLAKR